MYSITKSVVSKEELTCRISKRPPIMIGMPLIYDDPGNYLNYFLLSPAKQGAAVCATINRYLLFENPLLSAPQI